MNRVEQVPFSGKPAFLYSCLDHVILFVFAKGFVPYNRFDCDERATEKRCLGQMCTGQTNITSVIALSYEHIIAVHSESIQTPSLFHIFYVVALC